jgi:hypothetical protein
MRVIKDIAGLRFGRLAVIKRKGSERGTATRLCHCDCGRRTIATGVNLLTYALAVCARAGVTHSRLHTLAVPVSILPRVDGERRIVRLSFATRF